MHRNPWWLTPEGPTLDAGAFLVGLEWATPAAGADRRQAGQPPSSGRDRRGLAAEAARAASRRSGVADSRWSVTTSGPTSAGPTGRALRTVFVRTGKHGLDSLSGAHSHGRGGREPHAVAPSLADVVAALD